MTFDEYQQDVKVAMGCLGVQRILFTPMESSIIVSGFHSSYTAEETALYVTGRIQTGFFNDPNTKQQQMWDKSYAVWLIHGLIRIDIILSMITNDAKFGTGHVGTFLRSKMIWADE